MKSKFVEIRDSATFIPALALEISSDDGYLARRSGFGSSCILLIHLNNNKCTSDCYDWDNRTMQTAHKYLDDHWSIIKDGDVLDVEFILGETSVAKTSERFLGLDEHGD